MYLNQCLSSQVLLQNGIFQEKKGALQTRRHTLAIDSIVKLAYFVYNITT